MEQKLRNKIGLTNFEIAISEYKQKQVIEYLKSDIFDCNYLS